MVETYKSGGILAALHSSTTATTAPESQEGIGEEEDVKPHNLLADLFTKVEGDDDVELEIGGEGYLVVDELGGEQNLEAEVDSDDDATAATSEKTETKKKKKPKIEESPERLERTLFVGNVALTVTKKTLRKIFNKFGELDSLRFRSFIGVDAKTPRKVALIKKTFHAECKSMNAYIVYKDKDSVGKALQCNGTVLEGLHLRVDRATTDKKTHKTKQSVFVGNLPFNVTDEALHGHFAKCGDIESVRVIRDKQSGMGKGFGYVTFKNADAIVFGLKLNSSNLDGRPIRVYRATENTQQKNTAHHHGNDKSFQGLKSSTSKKDRVIGKRLVQEKTKSNAMRRLKGKIWAKKTSKENNKQKKGKAEKNSKLKSAKGDTAKKRPRGK